MEGLLLQLSKQRARVLVQIRRLQEDVASLGTQLTWTAASSSVAAAAVQVSPPSTAASPSVAPAAAEGSPAAAIDHKAEYCDMDDVVAMMDVLSV